MTRLTHDTAWALAHRLASLLSTDREERCRVFYPRIVAGMKELLARMAHERKRLHPIEDQQCSTS